jgi:hypothetical protein
MRGVEQPIEFATMSPRSVERLSPDSCPSAARDGAPELKDHMEANCLCYSHRCLLPPSMGRS